MFLNNLEGIRNIQNDAVTLFRHGAFYTCPRETIVEPRFKVTQNSEEVSTISMFFDREHIKEI